MEADDVGAFDHTPIIRPEFDDSDYLLEREAQERRAAAGASCMAKSAHLDLADMYAERAAAEG